MNVGIELVELFDVVGHHVGILGAHGVVELDGHFATVITAFRYFKVANGLDGFGIFAFRGLVAGIIGDFGLFFVVGRGAVGAGSHHDCAQKHQNCQNGRQNTFLHGYFPSFILLFAVYGDYPLMPLRLTPFIMYLRRNRYTRNSGRETRATAAICTG